MSDFLSFPERLRNCIKESGLTQAEIAHRVGISKHAFTKYLNGRIPETSVLYSISNFFGRSMEWFLVGYDGSIELQNTNKAGAIFDEELKMMFDIIASLMKSDNPHLRGWAIIQFEKAFKDYVDSYVEGKKQHA
jgi:transcriptional regulator with XRE-family HTH domain